MAAVRGHGTLAPLTPEEIVAHIDKQHGLWSRYQTHSIKLPIIRPTLREFLCQTFPSVNPDDWPLLLDWGCVWIHCPGAKASSMSPRPDLLDVTMGAFPADVNVDFFEPTLPANELHTRGLFPEMASQQV